MTSTAFNPAEDIRAELAALRALAVDPRQFGSRAPLIRTLTGTEVDIDFSAEAYSLTTTGSTTITLTGFPAPGILAVAYLDVTAGGAHSLTFDAGAGTIHYPEGQAPDAPGSGETSTYLIMSVDGGATVRITALRDWS